MAETLKDQADRLCHAYIEHPEDFKEIKPLQSCDISEEDLEKSFYHVKRDGGECFLHRFEDSSKPEKFITNGYFGMGTCTNFSVAHLAEDKGTLVHALEIKNPDVNGYSFGRNDKPLDYKGTLLLTDQYNSDLRLVTADGSVVLCGIVHELLGWEEVKPQGNPICEKFLKEDYQVPEESRRDDVESLTKADSLYDGELPRETHVQHISRVDLTENGKAVRVLGLELSSGSGCGCEERFMSIAKPDKDALEAQEIDKAITNLTAAHKCNEGISWKAITINGKAYIAENIWSTILSGGRTADSPVLSIKPFHDRVLYKYKNGKFSEICRLKPKAQRVIDRDVLSDDDGAISRDMPFVSDLNYVPVE